jgi:CRP/FNR family transcriptional regulator
MKAEIRRHVAPDCEAHGKRPPWPTDRGAIATDLLSAPLFADLSPAHLSALAEITEPLIVPAHEVIFAQGAPATAIFVLHEGQVRIYMVLRDGRAATLRHVQPGETFGEATLFTDAYPAHSETLTTSRIYRLRKDAFQALLEEQPQLALNLLAAQAKLMVLLTRRVEELLLPVPARLARYLRGLCAEQGTACQLPTSKREIAARLGTVPETLSRTLQRFKRAGVISFSGDKVRILDVDALDRLAQDSGREVAGHALADLAQLHDIVTQQLP